MLSRRAVSSRITSSRSWPTLAWCTACPSTVAPTSDGSFWIAEENAPSILHVAADGTIQLGVVPAGSESDFVDAGYEVVGGLPAILTKRQANRGIKSMAVSPDERSRIRKSRSEK